MNFQKRERFPGSSPKAKFRPADAALESALYIEVPHRIDRTNIGVEFLQNLKLNV